MEYNCAGKSLIQMRSIFPLLPFHGPGSLWTGFQRITTGFPTEHAPLSPSLSRYTTPLTCPGFSDDPQSISIPLVNKSMQSSTPTRLPQSLPISPPYIFYPFTLMAVLHYLYWRVKKKLRFSARPFKNKKIKISLLDCVGEYPYSIFWVPNLRLMKLVVGVCCFDCSCQRFVWNSAELKLPFVYSGILDYEILPFDFSISFV